MENHVSVRELLTRQKLEGHKKEATETLAKLRSNGVIKDEPAALKDYSIFLGMLREILASSDSIESRVKIIRALVRKVLISPEGFEVYFKVGDSQVGIFTNEWEKNVDRRAFDSGQKNRAEDLSDLRPDAVRNFEKFEGVIGSNTCKNGVTDGT